MKHFPMFGSLVAVIVGGLLTPYPGWASGSPVSFSGELGPDFLMYSAQGYLGVNLSEVDTDRITALHLKDAHGAEVTLVDHDAPAGKSGLKVHDVILLRFERFAHVRDTEGGPRHAASEYCIS